MNALAVAIVFGILAFGAVLVRTHSTVHIHVMCKWAPLAKCMTWIEFDQLIMDARRHATNKSADFATCLANNNKTIEKNKINSLAHAPSRGSDCIPQIMLNTPTDKNLSELNAPTLTLCKHNPVHVGTHQHVHTITRKPSSSESNR